MSKPSFERPDEHELASDVEERVLEWLIDGRIPRSLITLVAGRPGQGKSLWTAWLAAYATQRGENVIFSNLEDLKGETSRPRLRVAGADLNLVHFWTPELRTPEGLAVLEAVVKAANVKLLIIDPLSAHLPRRFMDDRASIAPIAKMCERTGLALVALHHTRKSVAKSAHALDAIKGAGDGFMAAARTVYVFGRNADDEDERVLAAAKANVVEEGSMTYGFEMIETNVGGETSEVPRLFLTDPMSNVSPKKLLEHGTGSSKDADPKKRAVAVEWLTSLLMFGELHVDEVKAKAEEVQISWRTVRRAADVVGVVKREQHRGFGKGRDFWWSLDPSHPAAKVGQRAQAAVQQGMKLPEGQMTVEDVLAAIDAAGTVPDPSGDEDDA